MMIAYLIEHWRGQQPIARALFVNGFLGYLALVGIVAVGSALMPPGWRTSWPAFRSVLVFFVIWLVWAAIGILRSALRTLREPNPLSARMIADLALFTLVAVAFLLVNRADLILRAL